MQNVEISLKKMRRNLTQREVAKYLGIAPSNYNGYEKAGRLPDIITLIKLADYYNCSLDTLVGRDYTLQKKEEPVLTDSHKLLISLYEQLPDERKEYIISFIKDQLDFISTYKK